MVFTDDFRVELQAQIERAQRQGRAHVEVNAGELHRAVGKYPGNHRMRTCCEAMRGERGEGDTKVYRPNKRDGASLTIRYRLPR